MNVTKTEWDSYWDKKKSRMVYDLVARFYRNVIIRNLQNYYLDRYFKSENYLLHAGCGAGETDTQTVKKFKVVAVDFSDIALKNYRRRNSQVLETYQADIRRLPFAKNTFDGIYNLGVMEHFSQEDITKILSGFRRILKNDGKIVLFWPPEYGLSVVFFKALIYIFHRILHVRNVKFHPLEISRLKSRQQAEQILKSSGFEMREYYFGCRDLFTYCVIVGKKLQTEDFKRG